MKKGGGEEQARAWPRNLSKTAPWTGEGKKKRGPTSRFPLNRNRLSTFPPRKKGGKKRKKVVRHKSLTRCSCGTGGGGGEKRGKKKYRCLDLLPSSLMTGEGGKGRRGTWSPGVFLHFRNSSSRHGGNKGKRGGVDGRFPPCSPSCCAEGALPPLCSGVRGGGGGGKPNGGSSSFSYLKD